jgi:hypothetical protein
LAVICWFCTTVRPSAVSTSITADKVRTSASVISRMRPISSLTFGSS